MMNTLRVLTLEKWLKGFREVYAVIHPQFCPILTHDTPPKDSLNRLRAQHSLCPLGMGVGVDAQSDGLSRNMLQLVSASQGRVLTKLSDPNRIAAGHRNLLGLHVIAEPRGNLKELKALAETSC